MKQEKIVLHPDFDGLSFIMERHILTTVHHGAFSNRVKSLFWTRCCHDQKVKRSSETVDELPLILRFSGGLNESL